MAKDKAEAEEKAEEPKEHWSAQDQKAIDAAVKKANKEILPTLGGELQKPEESE